MSRPTGLSTAAAANSGADPGLQDFDEDDDVRAPPIPRQRMQQTPVPMPRQQQPQLQQQQPQTQTAVSDASASSPPSPQLQSQQQMPPQMPQQLAQPRSQQQMPQQQQALQYGGQLAPLQQQQQQTGPRVSGGGYLQTTQGQGYAPASPQPYQGGFAQPQQGVLQPLQVPAYDNSTPFQQMAQQPLSPTSPATPVGTTSAEQKPGIFQSMFQRQTQGATTSNPAVPATGDVQGQGPSSPSTLVTPGQTPFTTAGQQQPGAAQAPRSKFMSLFKRGGSADASHPAPGDSQGQQDTIAGQALQPLQVLNAGAQLPQGQLQQRQVQADQLQTQPEMQPHGVHPGMAPAPGPVVVPEASGWCSQPPPPIVEVARIQAEPVTKSRWDFLNKPPGAKAPKASTATPEAASTPAATTAPVATGVAAAATDLPAGDQQARPKRAAHNKTIMGPQPALMQPVYGPFLRYQNFDPATSTYHATVLLVAHQSKSPFPPTLKYRDVRPVSRSIVLRNPLLLDSYAGYNFFRWDILIEVGATERVIEYTVHVSADHLFAHIDRHRFFVPSASQPWRWGFYSGNGSLAPQANGEDGVLQPLWRDVLLAHLDNPMHVMVSGGDQLSNDDVWSVPSLVQWLRIPDPAARLAAPFTHQMLNEAYDFFFRNYSYQFSRPLFAEALASIPHVMTWDCHDIFDDWGSYPRQLQLCPVFQGLFFVARKFASLFQHHAPAEKCNEYNKTFGEWGQNDLKLLGDSTALLALDTRSERSRDIVLAPHTWLQIQQQLLVLPQGVRHVVVLSPAPVVYPRVPLLESALEHLMGSGMSQGAMVALQQKSGLADRLMASFHVMEMHDDAPDAWPSGNHAGEKLLLVRMLQELSQARGFRFTLLSGGCSHVAAVGRLYSHPRVAPARDFRHVVQIICSAINNPPPAPGVLKALTAAAQTTILDAVTRERMQRHFGPSKVFTTQRNWCVVTERPFVPGGLETDGALVFQHRVEDSEISFQRPQTYDTIIPLLDLQPADMLTGLLTSPLPLYQGGQPALLLKPQYTQSQMNSIAHQHLYMPLPLPPVHTQLQYGQLGQRQHQYEMQQLQLQQVMSSLGVQSQLPATYRGALVLPYVGQPPMTGEAGVLQPSQTGQQQYGLQVAINTHQLSYGLQNDVHAGAPQHLPQQRPPMQQQLNQQGPPQQQVGAFDMAANAQYSQQPDPLQLKQQLQQGQVNRLQTHDPNAAAGAGYDIHHAHPTPSYAVADGGGGVGLLQGGLQPSSGSYGLEDELDDSAYGLQRQQLQVLPSRLGPSQLAANNALGGGGNTLSGLVPAVRGLIPQDEGGGSRWGSEPGTLGSSGPSGGGDLQLTPETGFESHAGVSMLPRQDHLQQQQQWHQPAHAVRDGVPPMMHSGFGLASETGSAALDQPPPIETRLPPAQRVF